MLKKFFCVGLIFATITIGSLGCNSISKQTNINNQEISKENKAKEERFHKIRQSGFEFDFPEIFTEKHSNFDLIGLQIDENGLGGLVISYALQSQVDKLNNSMANRESMTQEEKNNVSNIFFSSEIQLIQLQVYKKETLENKSIQELSGLPNNDFMGEQYGYIYYISYANEDITKNFEEYDKELYKEGLNTIEHIKKSYLLKPLDNDIE